MGSSAPPRGTGPGGRGHWLRTDAKVREVVDDSLVGTVLFVDLENPAVFVLRSRKDPGFLAGQEDGGVGPLAVDEAPDYNHDEKNSPVGRLTPTRKVQAGAGTAPNSNPWYFAAIFYHGSAPGGLTQLPAFTSVQSPFSLCNLPRGTSLPRDQANPSPFLRARSENG